MKVPDWAHCTEEELWKYVASHLAKNGIDTVLVGGAVVAVYSNGAYRSGDLDFVQLTYLNQKLPQALVASESSFKPREVANKKNPRSARGLAQITDDTRKILGDEKGELKDHFITATREDLLDPNVNICAGIRWLFHKRNLASAKLGREATWEEAVAEYKSTLKGLSRGVKRDQELMNRFLKLLEKYRKCEKK